MAHKTLQVTYWKQCKAGLTGYCLTERTQKLFTRVADRYNRVTGLKLSKMRMYERAMDVARASKQVSGGRMMDTANAIFATQLIELEKVLKTRQEIVIFKSLEISNIKDLARKSKHRRKAA